MDKEKEKQLIELLKKKWVSRKEMREFFKSANHCLAWIQFASNHYLLAEEKRGKTPYFKIMNMGDYQ